MNRVRVAVPRMGNYAVVFKTLINMCGAQAVIPPPITRRTFSLGSQHSPEFVCLPFKLNLGNYLEILEADGAEVLLQAGRAGACRYGFYSEVQAQIIADLGYRCRMVNLFSGGKQFNYLDSLKALSPGLTTARIIKASYLALLKMRVVEEMERLVRWLRPRETVNGGAERIFEEGLRALDRAQTSWKIRDTGRRMRRKLRAVPVDPQKRPLKVGLVGELYVVMETRSNLEVERKLGELGVDIVRPMCLSGLLKDAVAPFARRRVIRQGRGFISNELGAHAAHAVGHAVEFARHGLDGVIQLYPFTCMPEIAARAILGNVSRRMNIPVLSLSFSEQTGEEGLNTRLEAFVDLLERRREQKS